jgi:hypothetical protein
MSAKRRAASQAELVEYVRSRCVQDDDCLLWQGAMNNHGRPVFRLVGSGTRDPRRVLWIAAGRKLLKGRVFAKPRCNERCIAPEHQLYVTRAKAMLLASQDGRLSCGVRHVVIAQAAARKRPSAKLTAEIVAAMRARYAETGNAALVAREFGINHAHAHRVIRNKAWRTVTPFSMLD